MKVYEVNLTVGLDIYDLKKEIIGIYSDKNKAIEEYKKLKENVKVQNGKEDDEDYINEPEIAEFTIDEKYEWKNLTYEIDEILENEQNYLKREEKGKMEEFKNTIMGKITKGAIFEWGENNEKGEWFVPTEEQAEAMLSEGGLKMGENIIDYSSSEKARNGKTYGSEIAAIDGIVTLIEKTEGISEKEKNAIKEQMISDIDTKASLSPELSTRIKTAMEEKGIETSIIEVLGTIHDNWVKDNGKKFDDPSRAKKLYQFTDLRLMSYGGDGATADLLFLQPLLEGAGIEVDKEGKLKEEFEKQQKEYMKEHKITDSKGLREYLMNLGENYQAIQGVETTKGKTVEPVKITEELKKPEILERMTEQVCGKLGLEYEREVDLSEVKEVAENETRENANNTIEAINSSSSLNQKKEIDEQSKE